MHVHVANPVSSLPIINIGTFHAIAIIIQPIILGMHASFNVFSLPQLSIIKPPVMPPNGATITIALAKIKVEVTVTFRKTKYSNID